MPFNFLVLKHEALRIRDRIQEICHSEDAKTRLPTFAADNSWIQAFVLRKGLHSVRIYVCAGQQQG